MNRTEKLCAPLLSFLRSTPSHTTSLYRIYLTLKEYPEN